MIRIFLTLLGLVTAFAASAQAQTVQRDWTPYEQNKQCMISENYFNPSLQMDGSKKWFIVDASIATTILKWHVSGDRFFDEMESPALGRLAQCFDGRLECGLPLNYDIANELKLFDRPENGASTAYFRNPPPESAVRYAMAAVGDCFGSAGEGIYLDEVGLTEAELPIDICYRAGNAMFYRSSSKYRSEAPTMTDAQIAKYRDWGILAKNLIDQRFNKPDEEVTVCGVAPAELMPSFMQFYDDNGYGLLEDAEYIAAQEAEAAAAAQAAAEKQAREDEYNRKSKKERLLARNDYQRFGTLDGCQIAYSYVFNGINRDKMSFIVDPVPDSGISWALKFEKTQAAGQECPAMPQDLGDWIAKQDPKLFEAYGATEEFRNNKPNIWNENDWKAFVERWMWRDQTFAETYVQGGNCQAAIWYSRNIAHDWNAFNQAELDFVGLARVFGRWGAPDKALCAAIPPDVLPLARKTWERNYNQVMREKARQQAEWDAANRREAARRAEIDAAYDELFNWKPPYQKQSELRCYNVEETKYGTRQRCFSD
ncbi:hypothetical protein HAD_08090 [Hyphomonas adhaerens MHS-3]|uniref:YARHG domain-containing protein n=1 Tax=Hyphomonas adhaerens MHS-3 TaxID=1280949 RepID=A0A069E6M2_9PROT|nr:hypothetical protein [Hyphomonas adhaerens]KCZ85629.1 hypothetical protein HAD_08090 [Hyphomonas adhaerens MHS-3]